MPLSGLYKQHEIPVFPLRRKEARSEGEERKEKRGGEERAERRRGIEEATRRGKRV